MIKEVCRRSIIAGVCLSVALFSTRSAVAQTPYFTDFEAGVGTEWSLPNLESSETNYFTRFTGRFSNDSQTLTLTNLSVGQSYTVGFDLYVIDSWDGSYSGTGDYFNVLIGTNQVFHETFSNYNGNPPVNPQSFPYPPDEGRANFGFNGSYVDSVYRNLTVVFIASNSTTQITFQGQNLQAISDESWGIDNVSVGLTSGLTQTLVHSTTLPTSGSTNTYAIDHFAISASLPLLISAATNITNYVLREAGANGAFGDADDVIYPLIPSFTAGRTVGFGISNAPLQPGKFRFETTTGLQDTNGNAVAAFARQFFVANPSAGVIETTSNDNLTNATVLPMSETPAGSHFFTALGAGSFGSSADVDYWRFDAEAGDLITIRVEADTYGAYPQLSLQNALSQNLVSAGGDVTGIVQIQNYRMASPGTYYIRVSASNGAGHYRMRVDQSRAPQLEVEANDSQGTANVLTLSASSGAYQGQVVGSLVASDVAGDYYRLGVLNVGNAISANLAFPDGSSLDSNSVTLTVELDGNSVALATNNTGTLNFTVTSNGVHYVHVQTANGNLRAQYLLTVNVTDGVPPVITSDTLPAEGTTSSNIIDRVTLNFSEEVNPAFNGLNRQFRTLGTNAYLVTDSSEGWHAAEAQAVSLGGHLVTIGSGSENAWLLSTFSSYGSVWIGFTDQAVEGTFVWISGEPVSYTNWNAGEPNNSGNEDYGVLLTSGYWNDENGGNSHFGIIEVSAVDSDGDGVPDALDAYPSDPLNGFDLRAAGPDGLFDTADDQVYHFASYGYTGGLSASLRVIDGPLQPGNYRFMVTTSLKDRAGNAMASPYVRHFTLIGASGFLVENRNNDNPVAATSLSSSPGSLSDGSFVAGTGASVGANPNFVAAGQINGDTNLDLVTANYSSGDVSILLGNGNGTFQGPTNFTAGNGAIAVAIGDLNLDGKADLAVANYNAGTVSILIGAGNGSFPPPTNYNVGSSPRSVKLADFNGDGRLDVVTANYGNGNVSVLLGNGNGTFGTATNFPAANGAFHVAVADLNGDGRLDLVVANYNANSISVLLGNGNGSFGVATNFSVGSQPRAVAVGDLNGDGKPDLAVINANDNTVSVLLGSGNGAFGPATNYPTGASDPYHIVLTDLNGDGRLDVAVPNYGNNVVSVFLGNGDGTLRAAVNYPGGNGPVALAVGDFNRDGRLDLAIADSRGNNVGILYGNNVELLSEDPPGSGVRTGAGRGNLNTVNDVDCWTFTGTAGDLFSLAVEIPGSPPGSGLYYRIYRPDGVELTEFGAAYNGYGQSTPAVLPLDGTYFVQVSSSSDYEAEYRIRATTARPPTQMEREANDDITHANAPTLVLAGGHQTAQVLGYVGAGDPSGDYFLLGNLADGTAITLGLQRPASSGLMDILGIYNSAGVVLSNSVVRGTNLTLVIPTGGGGTYYARVLSDDPGVTQMFGGTNGYSLRLDGANSYVQAGDSASLRPASLTIEGWFNFSSLSGLRSLLGKTLGNGNLDSYAVWYQNGQLHGSVSDNSGFGPVLNYAWAPTPGVWYHVAYSFDSVAGSQALYVNGVLQDSGPVSKTIAYDTHPFLIGADFENGAINYLFPGKVDEVRVWNAARTQTQIQNAMSQSLVGNEAGLVAYWRLDEGNGSTAFDATSNGNNGSLVANPVWAPSAVSNVQPASLMAQYLLQIDLVDTLPPTIVSDTLPVEGSTNAIILDRVTLGFSEDMSAATVTNSANYDLRAAGPDNLFGTADDQLYSVVSTGYSSGLTGSYLVVDGPLQPGRYRFTTSTNLQDRSGNGLASPYVRQFSIVGVNGFVFEGRHDDTPGTATSFSTTPSAAADGSFGTGQSVTLAGNPSFIAAGFLNGDPNLDLVTANINSDNVSVLLGNGDGTFQAPTNFATGDGPVAIAIGDVNGDSKSDLIVANYNASSLSVLLGNGDGTFQTASNFNVGVNPRSVAVADFNGDGKLDLVAANYSGGNVSVLLGNGDGSFGARTNFNVASNPDFVVVADVNGDGKPDLIVANQSSDNVSVLLGNGNGSFGTATNFGGFSGPRSVALADLNSDGKLDLVAVNANNNTMSVSFGNGDGTFGPPNNYATGTSDPYQVIFADVNGDGKPDVVVANRNGGRVTVYLNKGDGTFSAPANYPAGSGSTSVVAGDFNHDGRIDLVAADYNGNAVTILMGNNTEPLAEDPPGSGVRSGWARGNIATINDVDYWSFTGKAGDLVVFASEVPGNPSNSGLWFTLISPDGVSLGNFGADFNGRGQSSPLLLPVDGTYTIQVTYNYQYFGEYRLRVTTARPPVQIESESNDAIGQADVPTLAFSTGQQAATMLGYISGSDPGDYYRLGNLAAGTDIRLNLTQPASSGLSAVLGVYNSAGTLVSNSLAGATSLVYTVTNGGDGTYYARVTAAGGTGGLASQYLLNLVLADTVPPTITSDNLPSDGSTNAIIVDRFALGFSEDMIASTVTNAANYDLRAAGPDGVFGTSDDQTYTVVCTGYSSGLAASYLVADGPLQPGNYRFTAGTGLQDRAGNGLAAAHVRQFSILGVSGFVFESRSDDTALTATSLSLAPGNSADGSFMPGGTFPADVNPSSIAAGLLDGDTNLDLVVANYGSTSFSVLLGNGDGTFRPATNYATTNGPIWLAIGDVNGDGRQDLVVASYSASVVSVFLGNGDGTFQTGGKYTVGTAPRSVVLTDLNGDGRLDIVTANETSDNISVLLGNGDGTFQSRVNYAAGDAPYSVAVGDLNGDGRPDIVTANANSDNLSVFLGSGGGTFNAASSLAVEPTPHSVAIGDLNGDGKLDIVSVNSGNNTISMLLGNGDGTFSRRINYPAGGANPSHVLLTDLDGDGRLDVLVANFNSGGVSVLLNNGDGTLSAPAMYLASNRVNSVATGDFNHDGRMDIAAANYYANSVGVVLGDKTQLLAEDPVGSGIRSGAGRGNVFNSSDTDFWSFSGQAGDWLSVAVDTPGNPPGSGLYYEVDRPDGTVLTSFTVDTYGWGQSTPVKLPVDGTYVLRVQYNYQYFGEYRFRVTLAKPPLQLESEDNSSLAQADALSFSQSAGHQSASVLGYISSGDGNGDYYQLGNLGEGTTVNLGLSQPPSSGLSAILGVYNAAGVAVATNNAGVTNLAYTIPAGSGGVYYARVTASAGTAGLFAQYIVSFDLSDTRPTTITSVSLPSDGTTISSLLDQFSLTVNKDLDPTFNGLNQDILLRNGRAYLQTAGAATWSAAEAQAESMGGHLVSINDQAENDWVRQSFPASMSLWIGLSDEALEGAFIWADGSPFTYSNWAGGQPDNSGNEDYVAMGSNGRWSDMGGGITYPGIIEVAGADTDGDGLPDTADIYPNDSLNVFDLRSSGADGVFDTADDQIYRLKTANYTGGLQVSFSVINGPLQPGNYRFMVTTSLRDRFGNPLATPFARYFTVADLPGYTMENRTNNTAITATPLTLVEDPVGLKSASGRGKLFDGSDVDYWSFVGTAGDWLTLAVDVPGNPGGSALYYRVNRPDGSFLTELYAASDGSGSILPLLLPTNGVYTVAVSRYNSFLGEYRLRVSTATPPLVMESEDNGSVGTATPVTLTVNGNARLGSIAGYARNSGDLDYFSLGTVTNGSTIFLNTRLPATSGLSPVVSIYNGSNGYINEAPGGRASDGSAQVNITQTGVYYAVVRGGDGTGGLSEQYVLDVQVVPTGSVSFPNLQVASVTPPSGSSIQSGQLINFSFVVQNAGSVATPVGNWSDRVVISQNTVLGDADDIQLGIYPHSGALNPTASYTVNQSATLPDGISGPYYLIVQADSGNAVNEFLLEGDNVTASSTPFTVNLAPYPDLRVENPIVTGPDTNNTFTINWTTANRGNAPANGGFKERVFVKNLTSGIVSLDVQQSVSNNLAVNATVARSASVTATASGSYQALITTDSGNQIFEYDAVSHASAEQNTFEADFQILQKYNIAVAASPAGGGVVGGGGLFAANTSVTVTAVPNTGSLPYSFANWTEGGVLQSTNASYTFTATRDRQLVADFTLPTYLITASNNPPSAGSVTGAGSFPYGTTNKLVASPVFGYRFTNWTENGSVIGVSPNLTLVVYSNKSVVANYAEANLLHVVTTATAPAGLASVSGAGSYTNGQSKVISAPMTVTNDPNLYVFQRFTLNGALSGTNASFNKIFATIDPTNMSFVAEYDIRSIRPIIVASAANYNSPVPATTNFVLTLHFDRSMNLLVQPIVVLTNSQSASQPVVPTGGVWSSSAYSNDTFSTPAITFVTGMDGTNRVLVSQAQDTNGLVMLSINLASIVIDATFPVISGVSVAPAAVAATVTWTTDEPATSMIDYGANASYGNSSPLYPSLVTAHTLTLSSLSPQTQYHFRVRSRDLAGNERIGADSTFTTTTAPDLVVSNLNVLPAALTSGNQITIQWNDANTAAGAASGSWSDQLVISNLTTGQKLLDTVLPYNSSTDGTIAAGGSNSRSYSFALPDGPAGAGNIYFEVNADAFNTLFESNGSGTAENNNRASLTRASSIAAYPDLQVTGLQITPTVLQSGTNVVIAWSDRNAGTAPTAGSFRDQLVVRNLTTSEILLSTSILYDATVPANGPVGGGQSRSHQFPFRLPDGSRGAGNLQFEMTVDANNNIFEYNAGGTGENNNVASINAASSLAAYPDLVVTNIVAPTNGLSGQPVQVQWTLVNQGNGTAAGPWTDQVFLSDDVNPGNDQLLGHFTYVGAIPPGLSVTETQFVTLPTFGTGSKWFVVRADSANDLYESNETNNVTLAAQPINIPAGLTLTFSRDSFAENAGHSAAVGTVSRNTDPGTSLQVSLSSSDTNKAVVPSQVVIPVGQFSATFSVDAEDNGLVDGTASAVITATAPGLTEATQPLTITDSDTPTLTVQIAATSILENAGTNAAVGYVTRNTDTNAALAVTLTSSEISRMTVPSSVTIPAGSRSVAFNLSTVDNSVPNATEVVVINAAAPGFTGVPASVNLLDDDTPTLTVTLADTIISEGAPAPATFVTVTRNPIGTSDLKIILHSLNTSVATVPFSAIIPAGQTSVTVPVTPVNNGLVDGTRQTEIDAYPTDALFENPIYSAVASAMLTVLDDDGPALSLSVALDVISESGSTTGTVTRNTPATNALVVALSSSLITEATVPATVTIPLGQVSATFPITGVSDGVPDGTKNVTLIADATGFTSGVTSLKVTDIDLPDLRVTSIVLPTNGLTGGSFSCTWTVANNGLADATDIWVDSIYLSTSPGGANGMLAGQATHTGGLALNSSYSRTVTLDLPATPDTYYLVVVCDGGSVVNEGSKRNNTLVSSTPIVVAPAYRATVQADVHSALAGAPIPLHGHAFNTADNSPAPFVPITVRIMVHNIHQVLDATTDQNGDFQIIYQPLPSLAGLCQVGADHPGVLQDTFQDQVNIYGMRFKDYNGSYRIFPGIPLTISAEVDNLGDLPLTGLTASVEGILGDVSMSVTVSNVLAASQLVQASFTMNGGPVTGAELITARIRIDSAEGATAFLPVTINLAPQTASLASSPGFLDAGMLRGTQKFVEFEIGNVGGAASGPIQVQLAPAPWLSLVSDSNIASITPGQSTKVILSLNPAADLPLQAYTGQIAFTAPYGNLSVPFRFRATSDATGDFHIEISDDYTYYVAGAPKVAGATVTLSDPYTSAVVFSGTTDTDGTLTFTNVVEGSYQLRVNADQHNSYASPVTILAGIVNDSKVFIDRQTVSYHWSVVPTEIPDHYQVVLESVFQAEVPIPEITLDNPRIMPFVIRGEDSQIELKLTNHGLIAAEQVQIDVPDDPDFEIIPLITTVDVFPAKSSMTIPVLVRAKNTAPFLPATLASRRTGRGHTMKSTGQTFTGCDPIPKISVKWSWICGPDRRWHGLDAQLEFTCVERDCGKEIEDFIKSKLNTLGGNAKNFIKQGGGAVRDLGNLPASCLCDIAEILAVCSGVKDECALSLIKAACGIAIKDFGTAKGGAMGFGNCWCPSLPSLPSYASPQPGGSSWTPPPPGYGTYRGTAPSEPIYVPVYWDYQGADCDPGLHPFISRLAGGKQHVPKGDTQPGAVCAKVRIRLEQQAVVTRAAFLGTLELENDSTDTPLTDIELALDFRDDLQQPANDLFVVRGPDLSGISAVDGTGTLGTATTGTAKYTFIPTHDAAPDGPAVFHIGGILRYTTGTNRVEVPLVPDSITVYPDPILHLEYFQQRDVFADDPFTDVVEPSEPFALGLIVKNTGKGDAINFTITSAQPKIVENQKGLLIDFKIIGTQVGSQPITPTLTANLGAIPAGQSQVAVWSMISSLQGKFIDYTASFENTDGLGDKRVSLIDSVEIHELIHTVRADRPGDDAVVDFLVNDVPDADNLPDTLYLSDGSVAPVNLAIDAAADGTVSFGHLQVHVTANQPSGWSYLQMPDPGPDFRLARVIRSDGKEIRVSDNAWTTDRSFPSAIAGAIRENLFHLLDYNGTGTYTLIYQINDSVPPTITSVGAGLNPTQTAPVSSIDVMFSEQIDLTTFDFNDLSLTLNGGTNLITSTVSISQISSNVYRISGLSGLTGADGNYTLTVSGAGIQDLGGNDASNSGSASWAKGVGVPVVASVGPIAPDPRNTPVATVDIVFSKPVNPATFDYNDVSLTRDGGPNLVTSGVTIVQLSPTTFRLGGLTALTTQDGRYVLSVNATGIQDTDGNTGISSLSDAWTVDSTGPAVVSIEQVTTNPRNIVVQSLDVTLSKPVDATTFDYQDVSLTLNGGPNLITSDVLVTRISDTVYRVSNFNWVVGAQGTYTLTVNGSGIADLAGNAGSGTASAIWQMETVAPPAPTNLGISPDLGASATDGKTSVSAVTLSGSLGETNLSVTIFDVTTQTDFGEAQVTGTNFSKLIAFTAAGAHHLQIHAADAAANVSPDVFFDVFVDLTPPSANFVPVTPDPRGTPVDSVDVTFSEIVNGATLGRGDFSLTLNGGTNLINPAVSILYVSDTTYRLSGLTGLTTQPGVYQVTLNMAGVQDISGNAGVVVVSESWVHQAANTPPVIAPITPKATGPDELLAFTIVASDSDVPANKLTFSLDPGAPAGAAVNPTNGLFTWTPTRAQAPSTNVIVVRVTDDGFPPLSAVQSFTVSVSDYSVLTLGTNVVRAGQSGSVPITLFASAGLTNVSFTLDVPTNRLGNLTLSGVASQVGLASIQSIASNRLQLTFRASSGASLQGQLKLADLNFDAASNQSSTFIRLAPTNVSAVGATTLTNIFIASGRVAIVGDQLLIEALMTGGQNRSLILYGKPGTGYQLQYSTNLSAANRWQNWIRIPMTNVTQVIDGVSSGAQGVFFRAYELTGNPPAIDVRMDTNRVGSLILFGQAGVGYRLEYATNWTGASSWRSLLTYTPTNAFYFIDSLSPSNPVIFYRIVKP